MTVEERITIAKKAISGALDKDIAELRHEIVGSTYIKDNHSSDVDILVLDEAMSLEERSFPGWAYGGSVGMGNDHWMSWKRNVSGVEVNMLIVTNKEYFNSWLTATEVCRFLHLQGYEIRTASVHGIHEIIMDDGNAEEENKNRNYAFL
jgi:hypothetical protein